MKKNLRHERTRMSVWLLKQCFRHNIDTANQNNSSFETGISKTRLVSSHLYTKLGDWERMPFCLMERICILLCDTRSQKSGPELSILLSKPMRMSNLSAYSPNSRVWSDRLTSVFVWLIKIIGGLGYIKLFKVKYSGSVRGFNYDTSF